MNQTIAEFEDQLLRMIVHDLRSPFSATKSAVYLCEVMLNDEVINQPQLLEVIAMARSSIATARDMIEHLSKIQQLPNVNGDEL